MATDKTNDEKLSDIKDKELLDLARDRADLVWLMSHVEGRRIIGRLFNETRVYGGGLFDKHAGVMAERIGRQEVGKWFQNQLVMAEPKLFVEKIMIAHVNKEEAARKSNGAIVS